MISQLSALNFSVCFSSVSMSVFLSLFVWLFFLSSSLFSTIICKCYLNQMFVHETHMLIQICWEIHNIQIILKNQCYRKLLYEIHNNRFGLILKKSSPSEANVTSIKYMFFMKLDVFALYQLSCAIKFSQIIKNNVTFMKSYFS